MVPNFVNRNGEDNKERNIAVVIRIRIFSKYVCMPNEEITVASRTISLLALFSFSLVHLKKV